TQDFHCNDSSDLTSGVDLRGDAQSLLHDRARGGVLEKLLLLRIEMVLDRERRERGLVKPRKNELLLARVGVDVTHGKDAGQASLNFLGIDPQGLLLELDAPFRDGPELRVQPEEYEQVIAVDLHDGAVRRFDVHA